MGSATKYILIAACGALLVLLLLMPRLPKSITDKAELSNDPLDKKVVQAVAMVNSGSNPMEGIMLLREVLDEDSVHENALLQLGYFSLQSQQYDNARKRFGEVVSHHPQNVDAWWELAHLSVLEEQMEKAEFQFEQVKRLDKEGQYNGVHFFLGKVYSTIGKNDQAIEEFEAYLPFVPDSIVGEKVQELIVKLRDK